MRLRLAPLLTLTLALTLTPACNNGSSSTQTPIGAGEGEACADGGDCQDGLFCLVAAPPADGVCTAIPAACVDDPSCTSGCFDAFDADCAGGSSCLSIAGNVTHSCT